MANRQKDQATKHGIFEIARQFQVARDQRKNADQKGCNGGKKLGIAGVRKAVAGHEIVAEQKICRFIFLNGTRKKGSNPAAKARQLTPVREVMDGK